MVLMCPIIINKLKQLNKEPGDRKPLGADVDTVLITTPLSVHLQKHFVTSSTFSISFGHHTISSPFCSRPRRIVYFPAPASAQSLQRWRISSLLLCFITIVFSIFTSKKSDLSRYNENISYQVTRRL